MRNSRRRKLSVNASDTFPIGDGTRLCRPQIGTSIDVPWHVKTLLVSYKECLMPSTNHTYRVTFVPDGCKSFKMDQEVRLWVPDPPPSTITLNYGTPCDGVQLVLIS